MGVLGRAMRQLRWSVGVRGVGGTVALVARRLVGADAGAKRVERLVHAFDTEHGVDTSGRIGGSHLGAGHAHDVFNTAYVGVPPSRLRHAVAQWREVVGDRAIGEYAFFDVGCGKGRAVMLASEMGFRECAGVELDPGLAEVARRNLEAWARTGKAQCAVRVMEGDATEVALPELPLLVYVYNPFRGPVVRKLLERLEAHAGERTGEMDLIYLIPNEAGEFAAFSRFQKMWEGGVRMSEEDQRWDDADLEDMGQVWRR